MKLTLFIIIAVFSIIIIFSFAYFYFKQREDDAETFSTKIFTDFEIAEMKRLLNKIDTELQVYNNKYFEIEGQNSPEITKFINELNENNKFSNINIFISYLENLPKTENLLNIIKEINLIIERFTK